MPGNPHRYRSRTGHDPSGLILRDHHGDLGRLIAGIVQDQHATLPRDKRSAPCRVGPRPDVDQPLSRARLGQATRHKGGRPTIEIQDRGVGQCRSAKANKQRREAGSGKVQSRSPQKRRGRKPHSWDLTNPSSRSMLRWHSIHDDACDSRRPACQGDYVNMTGHHPRHRALPSTPLRGRRARPMRHPEPYLGRCGPHDRCAQYKLRQRQQCNQLAMSQ